MIEFYKIKTQKNEDGYYILPSDVINRENLLISLGYHEYHEKITKLTKNTIIAIICSLDRDEILHINVNGWTEKYVRINGVKCFLNIFI